MLSQADKDKACVDHVRRSLDIHIGNHVLLSMKHLQLKKNPGKLQHICIRPFQVTQEIRSKAMKLDVPALISIQPVFIISLLKKYYGDQLLPIALQIEYDAEYKIDFILHH